MTTKAAKRAYKFRFHPDEQQEQLLLRTFGCVRLVYNKALQERTAAWRLHGRSVGYAETSAMLTGWKKTDELAFLNEVSSVPLQQCLRHLQDGFSRFWSKQNKYPKFKSRKNATQSAEFSASAFRWNSELRELKLAKTTEPLDIVFSRDVPAGATPSTVTVSLDAAGRWFVVLLFTEEIEQLKPLTTAVGLDLGIKATVTCSDGRMLRAPKPSTEDRAKLARAQRSLARKEQGSKNAEKARRKAAKIQARAADRRRDWLHKTSTALIRENQTVVVEDLAVKNLMRSARGTAAVPGKNVRQKAGLNRGFAEAGLGELAEMLRYKADWYGREVRTVSRWLPSTQLCGGCGAQTGPRGQAGLKVRRWECSSCGAEHDRDVNAAGNILAAGLAASVCGDGRSLPYATA